MPRMPTPTSRDPEATYLLAQGDKVMSSDPVTGVLCYGKVLQSDPGNARALKGLRRMTAAQRKTILDGCATLIRTGNFTHAFALSGIMVRALPQDPDIAAFESRSRLIQNRPHEALTRIAPLVPLYPDTAKVQIAYGMALAAADRHGDAVTVLMPWRDAGALDDEATNSLAASLAVLGRIDEAGAILLDAARREALTVPGLYNLVQYRDISEDPRIVERLETVFDTPTAPRADREMAGFALARTHDRLGNTDIAFGYLEDANQLRPDQEVEAFMTTIQDTCATVPNLVMSLAAPARIVPRAPRMVFIVGVPRSGTTLVEQILLRHASVASVGESPQLAEVYNLATGAAPLRDPETLAAAYLDALPEACRDAEVVLDKMPPNALLAGLALKLLPDARVIHCRRHPMASGFSAYQTRFADGHGYAYRLDSIAQYHRVSEAVMTLWQSLFPDRVKPLYYEALTESPARHIADLVAFCGLDPDPNLADFTGSTAPVLSASGPQVRSPIYRGSSDTWRSYSHHLTPLMDALAPDIAQYERAMAAAMASETRGPEARSA